MMKPTLYMMRGLPASGKSTKRRKMLADVSLHPIVAVNKDDIRAEMGITPGDFKREKEVQEKESTLITAALNAGLNLIMDNTHNSSRYMERYKGLARQHNYNFELIDFSHVSVDECIRRDAERTGMEHVGERIILQMYNQFYNKGVPRLPSKTEPKENKMKKQEHGRLSRPLPMEQNPNLPKALIVDLDGTLALATDRSWYAYSQCESDDVVQPIREMVAGLLKAGVVDHVLFVTGREMSGWDAAKQWLKNQAHFDFRLVYNVYDDHTACCRSGEPVERPVFHLYMKRTGDNRPDVETKRELFDTYIRDKFYVFAILEDRTKVVNMWRQMGLTCLQVADGDY